MKVWVIFAAFWTSGYCFNCLDSQGNNIDWYSVYKAASIRKSPDFSKGLGFFYLDVDSPYWTQSSVLIDDANSAVARTFSPLYNTNGESSMYIMYNDEPPPRSKLRSSTKGHTKGVVAFDKTSGYWMVHSVPHFPPVKQDGYSWNYNGSKNGQLFFCVTFQYQQLGLIAYQLFMNQPLVYDSYIPDDIASDFPLLNLIVKGKKPTGLFNVTKLTSAQGQEFISFAKSDSFEKDLYEGLLAPHLESSLKVETWLNGKGTKLPSDCTSQYKVINIREISLTPEAKFNETKDHSKWAVSVESPLDLGYISEKLHPQALNSYWVCAADINRMESQFARGGGALCLQHPDVWKAFSSTIAVADTC